MKLFGKRLNIILASKWENWVFIRLELCSISGPPLWRDMGYKLWNTPFSPSTIKALDENVTSCSGYIRTTVRCQKDLDNNYRTKPTSAWALVANGMNFELCKRGLGKDGRRIYSNTQWRYYNVSNLPPETFFWGQEDLCWLTWPASMTNLPTRSPE
jgi:hypothetical protein